MGSTENFGFQTLVNGESFDQNGYKFTSDDRHLIDRLLAQLMDHHHTGVDAESNTPEAPPTLELSTSGGNLSAGLRLYYKYTLVDAFGNETAASPLAYIDTPDPVAEPSAPVLALSATGGTLLPGTYSYYLTAYTTANTLETKPGAGVGYKTISSGTTNTLTLTMPSLPSGAVGFNIYRKAPGNPRYFYLDSTTSGTYVDDGSTDPNLARTLPNRNTTFSANKVTIGFSGATPAIPNGMTWKIYRTFDQSDWSFSVLHHVVEETEVGSGIIEVDYDDVGQSTSVGSPPSLDVLIDEPDKIQLTDAEEIQGSPPPGMLSVPHQIAFGQSGIVVEQEGVLVWTCEFDRARIVDVRACLGRDSLAINDIIFDIDRYTEDPSPTWDTIFTSVSNRPLIASGEWRSDVAVPDVIDLVKGDALVVNVVEADEEAATPTAYGFTITIGMMVQSGSATTSIVWP